MYHSRVYLLFFFPFQANDPILFHLLPNHFVINGFIYLPLIYVCFQRSEQSQRSSRGHFGMFFVSFRRNQISGLVCSRFVSDFMCFQFCVLKGSVLVTVTGTWCDFI